MKFSLCTSAVDIITSANKYTAFLSIVAPMKYYFTNLNEEGLVNCSENKRSKDLIQWHYCPN